jgi:hypothetical protein
LLEGSDGWSSGPNHQGESNLANQATALRLALLRKESYPLAPSAEDLATLGCEQPLCIAVMSYCHLRAAVDVYYAWLDDYGDWGSAPTGRRLLVEVDGR